MSKRESWKSWGWGWVGGQIPSLQSQLEQGTQAARRTPLSPALHAHKVTCIAGCHQKAIKFQAWDGVKYDLFCCLCALFILGQPFLRAQLGAALLGMSNRSKLWLLSRASFETSGGQVGLGISRNALEPSLKCCGVVRIGLGWSNTAEHQDSLLGTKDTGATL